MHKLYVIKLETNTKRKRNKYRIEPSKYTESLKIKTVKCIPKPKTGWKHHSTWVSLLQSIAFGRWPSGNSVIRLLGRGLIVLLLSPAWFLLCLFFLVLWCELVLDLDWLLCCGPCGGCLLLYINRGEKPFSVMCHQRCGLIVPHLPAWSLMVQQ